MRLTRRESLALLGGAAIGANAQFRTDVRVVNVFVLARDKQGRILRGLGRADFTVEEDGRKQDLRYFSPQSDLPLTLGLMIDSSGSMQRVLQAAREASFRFLDQTLKAKEDRAFIVTFGEMIDLLQDLSSDRRELRRAVDSIGFEIPGRHERNTKRWPSEGSTALYEAMQIAADEVLKKQMGRKALILISDGMDIGSRISLEDAVSAAQQSDTIIYSIRIFDKWIDATTMRGVPSQSDGKKALLRLSRETGGSYFEGTNPERLAQIYEQIEEELRSQYSLGYTPAKESRPGTYHRIKVTVRGQNHVAQAREGYYSR